MVIRYSKEASKFLKKQNQATRQRIIDAIEKLPMGDVKKLKAINGYRLRVGDYRIIYDKDGNIISIITINSRGGSYK